MRPNTINLRLSTLGYRALEFLDEDVAYLSKSGSTYIADLSLSDAEDILSTWEMYEHLHEDILDEPECSWLKRFSVDVIILRSQITRVKKRDRVLPNVKGSSSTSKSHTKPKPTHVSLTKSKPPVKSYSPKLEDFEYDPRVYEIGKMSTPNLRRMRLIECALDEVIRKCNVPERGRSEVADVIRNCTPPTSTHTLSGHGEISMLLYRAERAGAKAVEGT